MEIGCDIVLVVLAGRPQGPEPESLRRAEVAQLQTQRADAYDRASNWINNLLCAGYGHCGPIATGGEAGAPKSRRVSGSASSAEKDYAFTTAPNPADTWVTFNYTFASDPEHAAVEVKDATGRILDRFAMLNRSGQLLMDLRTLAPGLYTVSYTNRKAVLQLDRLIVK